MRLVHPDEGDGNGPEGEDRGIPDGRLNPLQEDGHKAGACAEGFPDPAEDSALLVGEHGGQLGCHHGRRNQKYDGCKEVVEGRRKTIFGLGSQSAQTHHSRHVHNGQRHHAELKPLARGCLFCLHTCAN